LKRGQRERKGWSARGVTLSDLQRKKKKRIKRKEEKAHLAEIHLNFEKFKI
jgi:hypothetical protein